MAADRDRFRIELDVDAGLARQPRPAPPRQQNEPPVGAFRIALIGDFSGRASRGVVQTGKDIAARRPLRVDRDTLDDAVARVAPTLVLRFGTSDEDSAITFSSLDDFHPDRLYDRLPRFRALRDALALADASTELTRSVATRGPPTTLATPSGILDAILGAAPAPPGGEALARTPSGATLQTRNDGGLSEFVQKALAPHLVASPDPSQAERRAQVDAAITSEMRALLHHPHFQALEAMWRGVAEVVRRLDTDANLQLYLIDVSRDELAADLAAGVEASGFYRLLVDGSVGMPGTPAWAVLAGLFSLGGDEAELSLLAELGAIAGDARAPFVAGASPVLAGATSIAASPDPDDWIEATPRGWTALRASTVGSHIGLALPRILLRMPYGERTDACELFAFEEFAPGIRPEHDSYLWGSGSLAVALLLGEAFSETGWTLRPGHEISGLPLHVYRDDGEVVATPCAEIVLSERIAARLQDRGLTPVLSVRDTGAVVLPVLRSIADPPARLAGRWTSNADGD